MRFQEELAGLTQDPEIRRLAERHAGRRELAEDALQETYWSIARVANPQAIRDLRAFFRTSLIHEIRHQRARPIPSPVEEAGAIAGLGPSPGGQPPPSAESEVDLRLLTQTLLSRLHHNLGHLTASVPGRSPDQDRYRTAIAATAAKILSLLLEGHVTAADWNAVLKAEYPQWCDQAGLTRNGIDQRLSRARRDVRALLRAVVRRDDLAFHG